MDATLGPRKRIGLVDPLELTSGYVRAMPDHQAHIDRLVPTSG